MTAEEKAAKAAELKAAKAAKKAAANVKVTTQVVDAGAAAADEAAILGVDTAEPEVAPSDEAGFASN
jgi:translation initiation factor 6 (eIF-6)